MSFELELIVILVVFNSRMSMILDGAIVNNSSHLPNCDGFFFFKYVNFQKKILQLMIAIFMIIKLPMHNTMDESDTMRCPNTL